MFVYLLKFLLFFLFYYHFLSIYFLYTSFTFFFSSSENGPYILLAPSEAAFSKLSRSELRQLSRGSELAYHLIQLRGQPAPEITNDSTVSTLLDIDLRFNVYNGDVFVNGAAVSRGDIPFRHGTIQVRSGIWSE